MRRKWSEKGQTHQDWSDQDGLPGGVKEGWANFLEEGCPSGRGGECGREWKGAKLGFLCVSPSKTAFTSYLFLSSPPGSNSRGTEDTQ